MSPALEQAHDEARFLERQPPVFQKLRLQFALDVETDTADQVYRIQCHGDAEAAALVEGIKCLLYVRRGWGVEVR
jgi:hypothetical protein